MKKFTYLCTIFQNMTFQREKITETSQNSIYMKKIITLLAGILLATPAFAIPAMRVWRTC